jgi:tRNA(Ile)-lysidine synthase
MKASVTMSLADQTYQTVQRRKLLPKRSLVVVGVSGGADSLALLHMLYTVREKLGCQLHVATLDHGLRGQAGAEDALFVERLAQSWGIPVTRGTVQAQGEGIEAAARIARYDFLSGVARKVGAQYVAVAHHADDQAETVLMRLLRGAGLTGMRAMTWTAPVPNHPDLTLVRPLLDVSRAQIEDYCREHDLQARVDATNSDTTLLRNRIRREILPYLAQVNPHISRTLLHLADNAATDDDYLQGELQRVVEQFGEGSEERIRMERQAFRALHPALQRRWVAWAAQQLSADETTGYDPITAAASLANRGQMGAVALLPGGLRLRLDYATIVVERQDALPELPDQPLLPAGLEIAVRLPGITPLPGSEWQVETAFEPTPDAARLTIPPDSIVLLRTRQAGDRFAPPGLLGHTQTLKAWMIDHKVPRAIRDRVPLLIVNGHIAALWTAEGRAIVAHVDSYAIASVHLYVRVANVMKRKP